MEERCKPWAQRYTWLQYGCSFVCSSCNGLSSARCYCILHTGPLSFCIRDHVFCFYASLRLTCLSFTTRTVKRERHAVCLAVCLAASRELFTRWGSFCGTERATLCSQWSVSIRWLLEFKLDEGTVIFFFLFFKKNNNKNRCELVSHPSSISVLCVRGGG